MNSSTIGKRKTGGAFQATTTAAEAMDYDDANAKRRKSSSAASPAQSPAPDLAIASTTTSATSLSIAPEAPAEGALVIASTAAAATATRSRTASSSSAASPAQSPAAEIAPTPAIASATPPVASHVIALEGTAVASLTTALDIIASTAIAGSTLRSSRQTDSSTSPDSNNKGEFIGPNGIVNLDAMFQDKFENDLATTSIVIDDYDLPTGSTAKKVNRDVENRLLAMMTREGKPMFKPLTKTSKTNQLGPLRKEDREFHDTLREKMKVVREGMSDEELKMYGRVIKTAQAFTATAIDDSRINPVGTGSGERICIAAMTSLRGKFPFVRRVLGPDGQKTKTNGSRSRGDIDPNAVSGMLGGSDKQLNNMKPGDKLLHFRGIFDIDCFESEDDPAFVAARQEAERHKDKLTHALEWCETNTKRNNGIQSGASIPLYEIIPSPDATNEDEEEEEVVKAKAKGDNGLLKAVRIYWEQSTSDDIPRFKGTQFKRKKKKKQILAEDIEKLLKKNNRARINGYIVAKFQSFEEYDACNVSDSLTFETTLHGGRKNLPKALPKRVLKR